MNLWFWFPDLKLEPWLKIRLNELKAFKFELKLEQVGTSFASNFQLWFLKLRSWSLKEKDDETPKIFSFQILLLSFSQISKYHRYKDLSMYNVKYVKILSMFIKSSIVHNLMESMKCCTHVNFYLSAPIADFCKMKEIFHWPASHSCFFEDRFVNSTIEIHFLEYSKI